MTAAAPTVLETARLRLRRLDLGDAPFILRLVNEPSWLRYIGDRGVRDLDGARDYIANGPLAMYARLGYGLWLVERKDDGLPLGQCGLLKRDRLEHPDIGFAFAPAYWGQGYAREAAAATLDYGHGALGMEEIQAITSLDNAASIGLLSALGFAYQRQIELAPGDPVKLFSHKNNAEEPT
ncbi:MAG: GNAT family N-acetyltransferase [Stagnimonas sp.]|nr:GNAT family N-acetyltransferase [Stagnimonas sp.]